MLDTLLSCCNFLGLRKPHKTPNAHFRTYTADRRLKDAQYLEWLHLDS